MTDDRPLVSVVIPARNEEADIEACLSAIAAQDWPLERLEVLVVDGASEDSTAGRARSVLSRTPYARAEVLENPRMTTPSSLNIGLEQAQGDVLCRVDARALVPPAYVATCVELLRRDEIVVAGGAQVAETRPGEGAVARGIARALRNPWATGGARYRRRASSGPSDTVYLGAFRTADLRAAGGWDERLATNQDYELNRRLAKRGLVWFESGLEVTYRPRSTMRALALQYHRFGRWKAAGWLESGVPLAGRQVLLLTAPPVVGMLAWRLARRRPALSAAVGATAAVLVDAAAHEPGPLPERLIGVASMGVTSAAWWAGVVEQGARHARGERLLGWK